MCINENDERLLKALAEAEARGYRAGQESMRERAAKELDSYDKEYLADVIRSLPIDNELHRVRLIEEALEEIDDYCDLVETIRDIIECANLDKFEKPWPPHEEPTP